MKKEERTSISVSKDTRDRFMTYLAELIGERKRVLTQDEVENVLLDCGEAALQKERELQG
ncbi:MAG: hypothetical protein WBZ42_03625 [Halobacteriota archaeon]